MKRLTLWLSLLALTLGMILSGVVPAAAQDAVVVGYQLIFNPWKVGMVRGDFEKATGRKIEFRRFDSPGKMLPALASGQVQIGLMGSSPIATAISKGLPVDLFWILESIEDAEALVVREGSGIVSPLDLKGKRLAVPFVSTTHFHTLFALELFGIKPSEMEILNMPPNAVAAAWERGDIDATFIWDPALSRVKKTGKVLLTSGLLGSWGKPTFDGLVVHRQFAKANPDFMTAFVKTLAAIDSEYRDNPAAWGPDSEQVKAIVKLTGGDPGDVPAVLSLYRFLTLDEQASCAWLGCGDKGGAARALKATSQFLKDQKKIDKVLDDYGQAVNPEWVERARGK